jgi:hypothetical protein
VATGVEAEGSNDFNRVKLLNRLKALENRVRTQRAWFGVLMIVVVIAMTRMTTLAAKHQRCRPDRAGPCSGDTKKTVVRRRARDQASGMIVRVAERRWPNNKSS